MSVVASVVREAAANTKQHSLTLSHQQRRNPLPHTITSLLGGQVVFMVPLIVDIPANKVVLRQLRSLVLFEARLLHFVTNYLYSMVMTLRRVLILVPCWMAEFKSQEERRA